MTPGFDAETAASANEAQREAADPRYCVFVEANAGSGKTRVLVNRVARLLLQGAAPDRILCVTFTKAAAGEMQTRLFRKLGDWSVMPDEALEKELEALTAGPAGDLAAARRLFARALETPGGLKIQTLHAYCESLLRRFPLEAGVPPGFVTQEEAESAQARAEAIAAVLSRAAADPEGDIADAIVGLLEGGGSTALEELTKFAASQRHGFMRALEAAGSVEALMDAASCALGVDPDMSEAEAKARGWAEAGEGDLEAAASALDAGVKKTDQDNAFLLATALDCAASGDPVAAFDAYCDFWLTQKGGIKAPKSLYTKALGETYSILVTLFGPEGCERHRMECEALPRVYAAMTNTLTRAAIRIAAAFLDAYQARLAARRALDFPDLVERARSLLTDSQARDWTLYKLDRGLEHVLVDEAQDTAPEQWAVITALSEEFFAGEGADGERARTVFCVGDEKQSIYSFQNADPKRFIAEAAALAERSSGAGLAFRRPPLDVSFRSCAEVLHAVDLAFTAERAALSAPERKDAAETIETKFLMSDPETAEKRDSLAFHRYDGHRAARRATPGCVEVWPAVPRPEAPEDESLELGPVDAPSRDSARDRLAEAVAQEIRDILERGERVWQEDKAGWRARPARPGDIVVLVRSRTGGLFEEIIRRLKLKDVPVAGADRMTLPDQLVVEDLLSLAKFALLPEDDLSLAEVLKSPFFHPAGGAPVIDDDALFDLTRRPEQRLWDKLRASSDPRFAEAREALERARARVDADAPYAFFQSFLQETTPDGETRLARLYARLGEEARDPCEEFLSRALAHERDGAPSLARFTARIESDAGRIKREMEEGRGEVRVMTVHAAKGLEAPIVFLPDTTKIPRSATRQLYPHPQAGLIWAPDSGSMPPLAESLKQTEDLKQLLEHNRLLYVAMTRARDRLIVCGHAHGRGTGRIDKESWLHRVQLNWRGEGWRPVETALHDLAREAGWEAPSALRYGEDPPALHRETDEGVPEPARPDWMSTPAPAEKTPARAIAPSRLLEAAGEDGFEPPSLSPLAPGGEARFLRGALIHKLLQTLPDIAPERRAAAADRFLAVRRELTRERCDAIRDETLAVLDHPGFAPIFGPGSRAEVALAGAAPGLPEGVTINGQIDRLVVTDHEVLIIDYKTNRPPPENENDVPRVYFGQMAAYRALLQTLHPGKPVRCALLWTDGPRLMELSAERLDAALTASRA